MCSHKILGLGGYKLQHTHAVPRIVTWKSPVSPVENVELNWNMQCWKKTMDPQWELVAVQKDAVKSSLQCAVAQIWLIASITRTSN